MTKEDLEKILSGYTESARIQCPECGNTRKKKTDKSMGLTVSGNETLYQCFHCGLAGKLVHPSFRPEPSKVRAISVPKETNKELVDEYLSTRSIDPDKVRDFPVIGGTKFFNGAGQLSSLGFVYGEKEAVKWRSVIGKHFTQDGSAKTLWGIDQLSDDCNTLIIVEGEMDVLACASAGVRNVVSVPNGAPQKVSKKTVDPEEDNKFSYIWAAKDLIEKVDKVILAVDSDEPGTALAEELARRIGRAKCWSVKWPDSCKDANDVVQKVGPEILVKCIDEALALPLEGVYSASDYALDIEKLYDNGLVGGLSTGLSTVDKLFTILPGQLSIVTGLPGSGKSEFVDQIMVNLAENHGWKFAIASFENPPSIHIAKLSEKKIGKPFFPNDRAPRMSRSESIEAMNWVSNHFLFLEQRGGEPATIDSILDSVRQSVMRLGIRGVCIDPYNYLSQAKTSENEHTGINEMLTKLVSFARANQVHIWFVAHPAKMATNPDGSTAVPKGMNISGSAAFFAKADLGVTVHLSPDKVTEIHCWKARFKWIGTTGSTTLDYDIPTGVYSNPTFERDYEIEGSKDWHETEEEWRI